MNPRCDLGQGLAVTIGRVDAGGQRILDDLSFTVAPGTVVTLMGPSGIGKSMLLHVIAGTSPPQVTAEAAISLDGQDLTPLPVERRRIGLLFQDALLFPHMTVAENLAFALPPGLRRAARRTAVAEALAEIGLADIGPRDPATLSGGQQARVALMRTLLARPRVLLLDEPFSKLDPPLRVSFRALVFGVVVQRSLPTVLVTHDTADAEAAGGPVIHLG